MPQPQPLQEAPTPPSGGSTLPPFLVPPPGAIPSVGGSTPGVIVSSQGPPPPPAAAAAAASPHRAGVVASSHVGGATKRPRGYQLALLEAAKKENVVIFLDTGSGKTYVAVLLIKEMHRKVLAGGNGGRVADAQDHTAPPTLQQQQQEGEDVAPDHHQQQHQQQEGEEGKDVVPTQQQQHQQQEGGDVAQVAGSNGSGSDLGGSEWPRPRQQQRRPLAVFMAPTVPLVLQQHRVLFNHIGGEAGLRVGRYYGGLGVDTWGRARWRREVAGHDVMVMTPEILQNSLGSGYINISEITLLIFDEAHHTLGHHPYLAIMRDYYRALPPGHPRPRVFGMTASPLHAKASSSDSVQRAVRELEHNLDCKVITVPCRDEVDMYVPRASQLRLCYLRQPPPALGSRMEAAFQLLDRACRRLQLAQQYQEIQAGHAAFREVMADGSGGNGDGGGAPPRPPSSIKLDLERINSRAKMYLAWVMQIRDALADLGPWCAAACLREVLRQQEDAAVKEHGSGAEHTAPTPLGGARDLAPAAGRGGRVRGRARGGGSGGGMSAAEQGAGDGDDAGGVGGVGGGGDGDGWMALSWNELAASERDLTSCLTTCTWTVADVADQAKAVAYSLSDCCEALAGLLMEEDGELTRMRRALNAAVKPVRTRYVGLAGAPGMTSSPLHGAGLSSSSMSAVLSHLYEVVDEAMARVSPALLEGQALATDVCAAPGLAGPAAAAAAAAANSPLAQGYRLVAPKVGTLVRWLMDRKGEVLESEGEDAADRRWSCIVFVRRKMTAHALGCLLAGLPGLRGWLRCSSMMGAKGLFRGDADVKAQMRVLDLFRACQFNCLVATPVAEEGLDLRNCQVVVCFDLPMQPRSFIQSRGRARWRHSQMVMMLEQGNPSNLAQLESFVEAEIKMREFVMGQHRCLPMVMGEEEEEDAMEHDHHGSRSAGCGDGGVDGGPSTSSPPLNGEAGSVDVSGGGRSNGTAGGGNGKGGDEGADQPSVFVVPATGARVTVANAKKRMFEFAKKLPADRYSNLRPMFSTSSYGGSGLPPFRARVLLPRNCVVATAQGHLACSRREAVGSACVEAFRQLHQAGVLDDHLMPTWGDYSDISLSIPDELCGLGGGGAPDRLPPYVDVCTKAPDLLRGPTKGEAAAHAAQGSSYCLHLHVLDFAGGGGACPWGILTRLRLPQLPPFEMFLEGDAPVQARLLYSGEVQLGPQQLERLKRTAHDIVSELMFKDVTSCLHEDDEEDEPWGKALIALRRRNPLVMHWRTAGEVQRSLKREADKQQATQPGVKRMRGDGCQQQQGGGSGGGGSSTGGSISGGSKGDDGNDSDSDDSSSDDTSVLEEVSGDAWLRDDSEWVSGSGGPYYILAPVCHTAAGAGSNSSGGGGGGNSSSANSGRNSCGGGGDVAGGGIGQAEGAEEAYEVDWNCLSRMEAGIQKLDVANLADDALFDSVLITEYNWRCYDFSKVCDHMRLADEMPEQHMGQIGERGIPDMQDGSGLQDQEEAGGVGLGGEEEEEDEEDEDDEEWGYVGRQEAFRGTFEEYYRDHHAFTTGTRQGDLDPGQPLLHVHRCIHCLGHSLKRANYLEPRPSGAARERQLRRRGFEIYLVPQLLLLHPLTATHLKGLKVMRSAMWRLQSMLCALELRGLMTPPELRRAPEDKLPSVDEVLAAVTTRRAHDIMDGERLETMGDAVLKYLVSLYLYLKYPAAHEGQLSTWKTSLISNRNLARLALSAQGMPSHGERLVSTAPPASPTGEGQQEQRNVQGSSSGGSGGGSGNSGGGGGSGGGSGIGGAGSSGAGGRAGGGAGGFPAALARYIRTVSFREARFDWPGVFEELGRPLDRPLVRKVKSKVLADAVEALLGAYYHRGGEWAAAALLTHLQVLPASALDLLVPPPPAGRRVLLPPCTTCAAAGAAAAGRGSSTAAAAAAGGGVGGGGGGAAVGSAKWVEQQRQWQQQRRQRTANDMTTNAGGRAGRRGEEEGMALEDIGIATPARLGSDPGAMLLRPGQPRPSPGSVAGVQAALGYAFSDPRLAEEAITHASCVGQGPSGSLVGGCYQRLEFLGDAVLDMLVTHHLYSTYSELQPGALTLMRMSEVNSERLSRVALLSGLHQQLRYHSVELFNDLSAFASYFNLQVDERCRELAQPLVQQLLELRRAAHTQGPTASQADTMVPAQRTPMPSRQNPAAPPSEQQAQQQQQQQQQQPCAMQVDPPVQPAAAAAHAGGGGGPSSSGAGRVGAGNERDGGGSGSSEGPTLLSKGHAPYEGTPHKPSLSEGVAWLEARVHEAAGGQGVSLNPRSLSTLGELLGRSSLVSRDEVEDAVEGLLRPATARALAVPTFGSGDVAAPKVLGDIVESLLAAVFLDSNASLPAAWALVRRLCWPLVTPATLPVHAKRELLERAAIAGVEVEWQQAEHAEQGWWAVQVVISGEAVGEATTARSLSAARKVATESALDALQACPGLMGHLQRLAGVEPSTRVSRAARSRHRQRTLSNTVPK